MLYCNGVAPMHAFMERPRCDPVARPAGWDKEAASNAVDVLIHSMRKKFGRALIRNIRGLGWTLMPGDAVAAVLPALPRPPAARKPRVASPIRLGLR